jgi:hypothetical protein
MGCAYEQSICFSVVCEMAASLCLLWLLFQRLLLFQAAQLKIEFRDHFRNITSIMDCVSCEKCKLWGKLQTTGLGTALKILFSEANSNLTLTRFQGYRTLPLV